MATIPAVPSVLDTTDTYYEWVKSRVQQKNAGRQFGGIAQARDWPQKQEQPLVIYLLETDDDATNIKNQSQTSMLRTKKLQWAWLVQGDNIAQNAEAQANRGDKYRQNGAIVTELLFGNFPGFCPKQQWSVQSVNNQPQLVGTPYSTDQEQVWWTPLAIKNRIDKDTGLMFGAASVEVTSFAPSILG